MTTTRETILQAARTWIMSAAGLTDDAQVIPANDKGPRPAIPYVTVLVSAFDIPVGQDEDLGAIGATVTVGAEGEGYTYVLTVNDEEFTYTRTADDTDTTVAAALAALVDDSDTAGASSSGAVILVWPEDGTLAVASDDAALTVDADGPPVSLVRGLRRGTLSVQGFGDQATTWLELAAGQLRAPDIAEDLDDAGLSIEPMGGLTDLAQLLETSIESRVLREFEVTYQVVQPARERVELAHAVVTAHTGRDPDDAGTRLSFTLTAPE